MGPPDYSGFWTTKRPDKNQKNQKNSVVTGIEPTASGLLDQRCSLSDNQAPLSKGYSTTKKNVLK